ncbi:MAG: type II toxin-antitoxin system VapC family toxin [Candidatus Lokiarchaeota archaeon]|nr:type II toxin-antitoxin system VapC family toxin [Candidatus Harpocratesius repetitus]
MIIIDTNVIIDIERGRKSLKALFRQFASERFCLSAISAMELYTGLGYSQKRKGMAFYQKQKSLIDLILNDFEIIPLDLQILKQSGIKRGILLSQGNIIDNEDIIIGITAEMLEIPSIITRNRSHFEHFNLKILSYL